MRTVLCRKGIGLVGSPCEGEMSAEQSNAPRSVGFPWGKLCAAQPLCDEGKPVVLTCLVRSPSFPSSVSSPVGRTATFSTGGEKAFGMQQPMKQCAALALASLGGSCHAAAQPQVTDEGIATAYNLLGKVTNFPLIRLFSLWSKSHPLRHSRIGARLKKPSRLAFSCASRPALRLRRGGRLLVGRIR